MAAGLLTTVPDLLLLTERVNCGENVAVTLRDSFTFTVQVSWLPLHDPPQPTKAEPDAGLAVRITTAPALYPAEHLFPQLIWRSEEETLPLPVFETMIAGTTTF